MTLLRILAVAAGLVAASHAHGASTVSVGSGDGFRNSLVTLPIRFQGDGDTVAFSADISYSTASFQAAAPPTPAGGATCTQLAPGSVRVSISGASALPSDVRYCDLNLRVSDTAVGGVEPIAVASSSCTDGLGGMAPCLASNGQVRIAGLQTSLPDGFTIVVAGYPTPPQESRRLRITNQGAAPLAVDCDLGPTTDAAFSITSSPTSIALDATDEVVVACTLPPLGSPDRLGTLECTTSDPIRSLLRYSLVCTTVAPGEPLPTDQLLDNQLKDGDQLGTSTAQAAASPEEVVVLGAPFAGGDGRGRIVIYQGDTQLSKSFSGGIAGRAASGLRAVASIGPPPRSGSRKTTMPLDRFGLSVAITSTSQRLAVGAPSGGSSGNGAVYVYQRPVTSGGWADFNLANPGTPIVIEAPAPNAGMAPGDFGRRVAFSPEGDLVIGAPLTDVGAVSDSGAVYRLKVDGAGFEATPEVLTSVAPVAEGHFGDAIAVDSQRLVVGAPQEGAGNTQDGAAYSFGIVGGTLTAPSALSRMVQQAGQRFGTSIAIGRNGVVVGSPGLDTSAGNDSGGATVFEAPLPGGTLVGQSLLVPESGATQGSGESVAINDNLIVVGAPLANDGAGVGQGRAYAYQIKGTYAQNEPPNQRLRSRGGRIGDNFGRAVSLSNRQIVVGTPLRDIVLTDSTELTDVGQADPFVLERVFAGGFEF